MKKWGGFFSVANSVKKSEVNSPLWHGEVLASGEQIYSLEKSKKKDPSEHLHLSNSFSKHRWQIFHWHVSLHLITSFGVLRAFHEEKQQGDGVLPRCSKKRTSSGGFWNQKLLSETLLASGPHAVFTLPLYHYLGPPVGDFFRDFTKIILTSHRDVGPLFSNSPIGWDVGPPKKQGSLDENNDFYVMENPIYKWIVEKIQGLPPWLHG